MDAPNRMSRRCHQIPTSIIHPPHPAWCLHTSIINVWFTIRFFRETCNTYLVCNTIVAHNITTNRWMEDAFWTWYRGAAPRTPYHKRTPSHNQIKTTIWVVPHFCRYCNVLIICGMQQNTELYHNAQGHDTILQMLLEILHRSNQKQDEYITKY